jgi:hypothetical protein
MRDTGVVDEQIDRPEAAGRLTYGLARLGRSSQVRQAWLAGWWMSRWPGSGVDLLAAAVAGPDADLAGLAWSDTGIFGVSTPLS